MEPSTGSPVALVVDDEPELLRVLTRSLENLGYQVLAAASREDAARFATEAQTFDLLVTDIFLGDGWGGELAFKLQQDQPGLPVVFISGKTGDDPVLRHGIQDHMVFLEKPFTLAELEEAVKTAIEKASA